ncbi:hypothetical protein HX109_11325 [Galbibacter sp. BG1]|uniref:hypothetical protein n=1 Tax=Galbibacter sp. BG1 TaxID=1170699 RepID=UPI0015C172F7|nr:hypothetical protein [Galbibacter sp. BG1]QLE02113.1 hypothetical protein HX109_11325 [Galbibacter sp. BG1]
MKKSILKMYALFATVALVASCSDDDSDEHDDHHHEDFAEMESDWVRLTLINDGNLEVMQANSGEIEYTVAGDFVGGERFYTTTSGRYLGVVDREGGKVRFFDSGIVNHDEHGHEYQAKWANAELTSVLPTHFTASEGHILVFNDGDGSISHIDEAQLEIPSYQPVTYTLENTVAHHGAGFRLHNGKFAATFKNNSQPGGLPQMVKFIDAQGNVIDDNGGVEVGTIHGDATNGEYGVFGATDGIILVDDKDNIDLIPNADGLNAESGNWLGTVKGHDNSDMFFGRASNLGVFMINPMNKTIDNIYPGNDVANAMFSFDGSYFIVHTKTNNIIVFDGLTGSKLIERTIEVANIPQVEAKKASKDYQFKDPEEEASPVLVTSDKFLYVLAPNRTQIKVLEIDELNHVHTIELEDAVEGMYKNGFSIEGEQHPGHDH